MNVIQCILGFCLNLFNLNKTYRKSCLNNVLVQLYTLFSLTATIMSAENSQLRSVLQGNRIFTKNLYNILAKSDGNVFFSPISIHAILSLTAQGSDGNTREAFIKTLHVSSLEVLAEGYKNVMNNLNDVKDVTLYMANKVYIQDSYDLKEAFNTTITKYFHSEIQSVNFVQSSAAAQTINNWVENKTNKKIKDLVTPEDFDENTRLVLVNAIYFKGNWAEQFDPKATTQEKFYISESDSINVQMMHIKKKFFYKEDENLDAKILELPYTNKYVSMIIILPNKRTGISELEQKLTGVDLTKITDNMYQPEVEVSLPKFKIETTIELNEPLAEMGLSSIFGEKANFSGMLKSLEPLCVSKVLQKAFIEVNEEGAEAAAATAGFVVLKACLRIPQRFTADHPFIVALVVNSNETSDTVLFTGRVKNPISS